MTFCVECGRDGPVLEGLCQEDFAKRRTLVAAPEFADLPRCVNCGQLEVRGAWIQAAVEDAVPSVVEGALAWEPSVSNPAVRWTFDRPDEHRVEAAGEAEYDVGPWRLSSTFRTTIRLRRATCPTCSRRAGRYYVGIVQVRATGRALRGSERKGVEGMIRPLQGATPSPDFVSRVEEADGGLDVYVSTSGLGKRLAAEIASRFGGTVRSSAKLQGRKDGEDLYRTTYLVRLAGFRNGDRIRWRRATYRVVKVGDAIQLEDEETGQRVRAKPRDLKNARLVQG